MMKRIITVGCVLIMISLVVCLPSCGKQDEKAPDPGMVKTFKIDKTDQKDVPRPTEKLPPQDPSKKATDNYVATEPLPVGGNIKPSPSGTTPGSLPSAPGSKNNDPAKSGLPVQPAMPPGILKPGEPVPVLDNEIKTGTDLTYKPTGRVDPFEPLIQFKTDKGGSKSRQTIRDTRRDRLTPLEKLDISQLKLTGVVLGSQKIAMVQESTGKGHNVKVGTYIGINSGRVVEINKDGIIIEEEVEDILGKIVTRKRELKLPKPLGEM